MYNVYIKFYTDGDLRYEPCSFEKELDCHTNRTNIFCNTVDEGYRIVKKFLTNIREQLKDNDKHELDYETFGYILEELEDYYNDYVYNTKCRECGDYISQFWDIGNMEVEILITPLDIEVWKVDTDDNVVKVQEIN